MAKILKYRMAVYGIRCMQGQITKEADTASVGPWIGEPACCSIASSKGTTKETHPVGTLTLPEVGWSRLDACCDVVTS